MINLVVSEVNGCNYCLSTHTQIGKMNGFSEDQILEIRKGHASFDNKLDTLAKFVKYLAENKGQASSETKDSFFSAGYSEANLIDVVMVVGDKTISNYINNLTNIDIDFPIAVEL